MLLVAKQGEQITDPDQIVEVVRSAIAEHPQAVADFRDGKREAAGYLVGQVMRATKGRANPVRVNELISAELAQKG